MEMDILILFQRLQSRRENSQEGVKKNEIRKRTKNVRICSKL